MGSQVIAICKCGVNYTISVGGGKLNYKEINYFPSLCPHCYDIVQTNLRDKKLTCPNCNKQNTIPFNEPRVIGRVGKEIVERSYKDLLTNGTYYCPKCESMTLRFKRGDLHWD